MVQNLRTALIDLFLGFSAIVAWNLLSEQDRLSQSNIPGVDPGNPLAQYGIESAEHQAYVSAKIRYTRYKALELETGVITLTVVLWVLLPILGGEKESERRAALEGDPALGARRTSA